MLRGTIVAPRCIVASTYRRVAELDVEVEVLVSVLVLVLVLVSVVGSAMQGDIITKLNITKAKARKNICLSSMQNNNETTID